MKLAGVVLTVMLVFSKPAGATPWQVGDVITYSQSSWGDTPAGTNPSALVVSNFDTVYPLGFEVGIPGAAGFSMRFFDAFAVLQYLPAGGAAGALNADLIDPTSSPSGFFGGVVVALKLNVDFSDAGLTLGALGIPFGDLFLINFDTLPALNGLTVRELLGVVNTALGGGTPLYPIDDLATLTFEIDQAFEGGTPTTFAQDHLVVPEPGTLLLLAVGVLGLAVRRKCHRELDQPNW